MNFLDTLKRKRELRDTATADYRRLVAILAAGNELAAGDGKRLEQVVTELALNVADVETDLAALQAERRLRQTSADADAARHQHRCATVRLHENELARTQATSQVWERFSPVSRDREIVAACNRFNAESARLSSELGEAQRRLAAAGEASQDLADLHRGHPRLFDVAPDPESTPVVVAAPDRGELAE